MEPPPPEIVPRVDGSVHPYWIAQPLVWFVLSGCRSRGDLNDCLVVIVNQAQRILDLANRVTEEFFMSEPKAGIRTTEFWLTAVSNIAGAVLALMAAYGLLKNEDADLWLALVQALAVAVIPLALAYVNGRYISARAEVKRGE